MVPPNSWKVKEKAWLASIFHERSVTPNSRKKKWNEPTTMGKNKEKKIRHTNHCYSKGEKKREKKREERKILRLKKKKKKQQPLINFPMKGQNWEPQETRTRCPELELLASVCIIGYRHSKEVMP